MFLSLLFLIALLLDEDFSYDTFNGEKRDNIFNIIQDLVNNNTINMCEALNNKGKGKEPEYNYSHSETKGS